MYLLQKKMPDLCGYAVTVLAAALLTYTAACAPRAQEQWNSYYYGGTPVQEQGITYYDNVDADENYTMPADMEYAGEGDRNLQVQSIMHGNPLR
jgi:hypothetical protein